MAPRRTRRNDPGHGPRKRRFGTVYRDRRDDGSTRGWAVRWTDADGRRRHRRGFELRGQAEDFVLQRFGEVQAERARRRGDTPDSRLPLRDLKDRILAEWKTQVRPVTHKNHGIALRQWAAALGDRPVRDVDITAVQSALNLMARPREEGDPPDPEGLPRGLSPSSIRTMRWALSGAFQVLRRDLGVPVDNPCQGRGNLKLPRPQHGEGRTLTEDEVARLLAKETEAADSFDAGRYGEGRVARGGRLSVRGRRMVTASIARRHVLTGLAYTGLRPEELRHVRWAWVSSDYRLLRLGHTKTGEERVVPVLPPLEASLRLLRQDLTARGLPPRPEDLVWPMAYESIRQLVIAAGEAAGLGHVTPYVLRRTFATIGVENGLNIEDLVQVMGHSINTAHRYVRNAGKGAVERVGRAFGKGFGTRAVEEGRGLRGAPEAGAQEGTGTHPAPPSTALPAGRNDVSREVPAAAAAAGDGDPDAGGAAAGVSATSPS